MLRPGATIPWRPFDIFACPITGEPLRFDDEGLALVGDSRRCPVEAGQQVDHRHVLGPAELRRRHPARGLAVVRSLARTSLLLIVARRLPHGRKEAHIVDRIEPLVRTFGRERLLSSFAMHLLRKPG